MFNALLPPIYRRLRQRAGLTQIQLAAELGIGRTKMGQVERGLARLSAEQEEKLLKLARCSRTDTVGLMCEQLSDVLDEPVGILGQSRASRPARVLGRARRTAARLDGRLPAARLRALNDQIHTTQLTVLVCERSSANLEEMVLDCETEAGGCD